MATHFFIHPVIVLNNIVHDNVSSLHIECYFTTFVVLCHKHITGKRFSTL